MPLDSSQLDSIRQWIESRSPILNFSLLVEPKEGNINYKKGYPMVAVTCKNCGYTVFFNAIQIGIMGRS